MRPIWPRDGRKRYPEINLHKKKHKTNAKNQKQKQMIFYECVVIFSKIGGRNGSAFTEVVSINVIKTAYKT